MKIFFTILLLTSIIGFTAVGLAGMYHGSAQSHGGDCVLAASQGEVCPKQMKLFEYVAFHVMALKALSLATVSMPLLAALLLIIFIAILCIGARASILSEGLFRRINTNFVAVSDVQCEYINWLSLHENSPSLA